MKKTIQIRMAAISFLIVLGMSSFYLGKNKVVSPPVCPVPYSVTSTIALDYADVNLNDGNFASSTNVTNWSNNFFSTANKIWFTIDFPASNPAGTLTFTRTYGGVPTVLQTISVPANSANIVVGNNFVTCGAQYNVDFN